MTLAELLLTFALTAGLLWALRPLRRRVVDAVAWFIRPRGPRRVIEGRFRVTKPDPKEKN